MAKDDDEASEAFGRGLYMGLCCTMILALCVAIGFAVGQTWFHH